MKRLNSRTPIHNIDILDNQNIKKQFEISQFKGHGLQALPVAKLENNPDFLDKHYFNNLKTNWYSQSDTTLWIGSCMAEDFALVFRDEAYNKINYSLRLGHGINSFVAQKRFLEWIFLEKDYEPCWENFDTDSLGISANTRTEIKSFISSGIDSLFCNVGSQYVMHDLLTGQDIHIPVPEKYFDPDRHIHRKISLTEMIESFRAVDAMLKEHISDNVMYATTPFYQSHSYDNDLTPIVDGELGKSSICSVFYECAVPNYFPAREIMSELIAFNKEYNYVHVRFKVMEMLGLILGAHFRQEDNTEELKIKVHKDLNTLRSNILDDVKANHPALKDK